MRQTAASPDEVAMLRFPDALGIELRRRDPVSGQRLDSVYLSIHQHYRITVVSSPGEPRDYLVITDGYSYVIRDREHREILAFHWHPGQRSVVDAPHLHIGSAILDSQSGDLGKAFSNFHIPTGHISIAQVVRLLLTEFDVVPNRQDWEAILGRLFMAEA